MNRIQKIALSLAVIAAPMAALSTPAAAMPRDMADMHRTHGPDRMRHREVCRNKKVVRFVHGRKVVRMVKVCRPR